MKDRFPLPPLLNVVPPHVCLVSDHVDDVWVVGPFIGEAAASGGVRVSDPGGGGGAAIPKPALMIDVASLSRQPTRAPPPRCCCRSSPWGIAKVSKMFYHEYK